MFEGTHTALVTPFKDGKIDEAAYRTLIDQQFAGGVSGVVPVGTTGESPTLSHDEHKRAIELAIEHTNGRGLVIAGTGSNSTEEAIGLTKAAEAAGADASLLVCPYYNKPSQEGLFQHYKAIADASAIKIVLYSIPGRSGIEIGVDTTARLAEACPNILAMKEAGGSVDRVDQLVAACPENFEVVSGDDPLTLPFMAAGAVGVISVASNIIPGDMSGMVKAVLEGRWEEAMATHRRLYPVLKALMGLDTNPVGIKTALALRGDIDPAVRLPLVAMSEDKIQKLRAALTAADILKS